MDTLIENGDFKTDVCGYPKKIYSIDEACQRVNMILSTKKGEFIYDREFGADFSGLLKSSNRSMEAELRCREAVADQKEISIGGVTVDLDGIYIVLNVEVIYGGKVKNLEVRL